MTVQATIIIPTFNHGPTLLRSVPSVLQQTVQDVEVIVIGDGVPDSTRSIMAELTRSDGRVRFIDNPKHESRSEPARHEAVLGARGHIVCYLGDDDLYLPNHVETMLGALRDADFAHALPLCVAPNGYLWTYTVGLEHRENRRYIAEVDNRIPLTAGAHTSEAYRRLPAGWRIPPRGTPADLHMWRTFLAQPWCRFASVALPTVLVFPSPFRRGWTVAERVAELDQWRERLEMPGTFESILEDLAQQKVREAARLDAVCWELHVALVETARTLDAERAALSETARALDAERRALTVARALLCSAQEQLSKVGNRLAMTQRRPEAAALRMTQRLRQVYRRVRRLTATR
jgi:GalNAc5-diNAcBac-PP-undecaprenol beta-1,3-glucosyltransferase